MNTENRELQLAEEFIRDTGCHLFLTGRAGTGKTTFLHKLKRENPKRLVVTAPTGVAAINAGGVTLHSFFQLPFGPFVPGGEETRLRYRLSRKKIDIIKSLDLLIIDEISMVRADLLDGVDQILRHYRRIDRPFGGVQLLMIGDLFQLPPVVKEEDWQILRPYYDSPYFFSSNALTEAKMVTVELTHIYRQTDRRFIDILNRVRSGTLDKGAMATLSDRYCPDCQTKADEGYITLSTHNRSVDRINAQRIDALKTKAHAFAAEIEGDFPQQAYPAPATLKIKPEAQVMFVRNDNSPERRYFNGKIGKVVDIDTDAIRVQCQGDADPIWVEPATWENIEYSLNSETNEISENTIGAFTQYPLRLAWAVTIHKSQGLTFEQAIIDAQAAFAHGQVYVALSRCRTMEGMVLSTPIRRQAMKVDPVVQGFDREIRQNQPSTMQLTVEKTRYQQQLLEQCFDFISLRGLLGRLVGLLLGNAKHIHLTGVDDLRGLQQTCETEIFSIGEKFIRQLTGLFPHDTLPADNPAVLDRIAKASAYFQKKIDQCLVSPLARIGWETDNTALKTKANRFLKLLREETAKKSAGVKICADGFSATDYFRAVSTAAVAGVKEGKSVAPSTLYKETDIAHPVLFQTLKEWRSDQAKAEGIANYQVLHQKTLIQIAIYLPDTLSGLKKIHGIGKQLAKRYGQALVEMVKAYREKHRIETVDLPATSLERTKSNHLEKPEKSKKTKIDTKQATLDLFEQGLTLSQIAERRGLVVSTIEGHMAHWVKRGDVAVDRLVPPEKRSLIEQAFSQLPGKSMNEVKAFLGADVSYGEIKVVQAHLARQINP